MRKQFDKQLENLNAKLVEMSEAVEQAIANTNTALTTRNTELAKEIIACDDDIDAMEKEIESLCLKLIIQQQPVASDLRLVSAVLKILTDVERIGDHASDISEIICMMNGKEYIKKLEDIPQMAEVTQKMVHDSIVAFVSKDIELAKEVIATDDKVDDLFVAVKDELIVLINNNQENGDQAIDLIMIAKYFERIGDHAVNIAEWVIFSLTGFHKDSRVM
ncbi:MAG: phosphate signaling complex protein PhoU [Lachnospiraceae bacterium]|nr:phosphate signaling complex protein PhoU [Lachnospiraceae bacterium]